MIAPRASRLRLALPLAACLAALAPSGAAAQAQADAQSRFSAGEAARAAGDHAAAMRHFYAALETLRAQGRGGGVDAGLVGVFLALEMAALDHPQTDDAFRFALRAVAPSADLAPAVRALETWTERLRRSGREAEAAPFVLGLAGRLERPGLPDGLRLRALELAMQFLERQNEPARAQALFAAAALHFAGDAPRLRTLRGTARLERAFARRKAGDLRGHEDDLDAAIDDLRAARRAGAGDLDAAFGGATFERGRILYQDGLYRRAQPLFEEAAAALANVPDAQELLYSAMGMRVRLLERLERLEDALAAARENLDSIAARRGADSAPAVAARIDLAETLLRAGRPDEAWRMVEEAGAQVRQLANPALAAALWQKASALRLIEENHEAAWEAAEKSLALYRETVADAPATWIEAMRDRASASLGLPDPERAERAHADMVALSERIYGPDHPEIARDLAAFAAWLQGVGRNSEAESLLRRAYANLRRAYGERGLKTIFAMNNLGALLVAQGQLGEGGRMLLAALEGLPDGDDVADFAATLLVNVANALVEDGQPSQALEACERAQAALARARRPAERLKRGVGVMRMRALADLGDLAGAWKAGGAAVTGYEPRNREDAATGARALLILADVARRSGDHATALALARDAESFARDNRVDEAGFRRLWANGLVESAFERAGGG